MIQLNQNHITKTEDIDSNWKTIYKLGGVTAIMAIMGTLIDITLAFIPGWGASTVPENVVGWFTQFQYNWLLGLRNLDLLNVLISILMIPMFYALFAAHQKVKKGYGTLAIILFIIGTTIFIVNNTALPMLELSSKYASATTETQKVIIAAAGEAMLARGEHGSLGAFMGFALSTIASISFSFVMLKGKIFSKAAAYVGILGFVLLLIYTVFVTFVSSSDNIIMMLAMPGGLLALGWNILIARKLLQLGKKNTI
jgi:hypothetical protein